jgi:ParB family transcriptional regulator, chromosome partitioning protein
MGKSSKIAKEITSTRVNTFFNVPLDRIKVQPDFNARKDFGDLLGLAKDIAARGLDYPLIVRYAEDGQSVLIIDGERRYRAIKLINEKKLSPDHHLMLDIPCIIEEKGIDEAGRCYKMLSTGINAKPLTEMEQADVIFRLTHIYKQKPRDVALKLGRTQTHIAHLLDLRSAPHDVKMAVQKKQLSATAAVKVAKASPAKRAQVMEKVNQAKPGKKVKVSEVEKITKGTPASISAKSIKDKISHVDKLIAQTTEPSGISHWTDVKEGLEVALGTSSLPPL